VDQLIVKSIVTAAHGLGKRTIAEYVGNPETVVMLRDIGVDFGQGYHLGRPEPLAQRTWTIPQPRPADDDRVREASARKLQ